MAGIGFALRKAHLGDGLVGAGMAAGHAVVVSAGPWLFAICSVGLISWVCTALSGPELLADFRVVTIYSFSLSLVVSAPVCTVAMRLVADALFTRRYGQVGAIFTASLCLDAALVVLVSLIVFFLFFGMDRLVALSATACSTSASFVWIATAFCSAVKEYGRVSFAFLVGFGFAVVSCIWLSAGGYSASSMVTALAVGLSLTFLLLCAPILRSFPNDADWYKAIRSLAARYRILALAGFFAAASIWADKWVFWFAHGEQTSSGLWHSPLYDGAMFIGCLAVIPALAGFVLNLELVLFQHSRRYLGAVLGQRTLAVIEQERQNLEVNTVRALNNTILLQIGISSFLVMLAPLIVELAGLRYAQLSILRFSFIGGLFQLVFFASSAIVIFCDQRMLFLTLQFSSCVQIWG